MSINLPQKPGHGVHIRGKAKSIDIIVKKISPNGNSFEADVEITSKLMGANHGSTYTIHISPGENKPAIRGISVGINIPDGKRQPELYCQYSSRFYHAIPKCYYAEEN